MQDKEKIYASEVMPLIEQIYGLCEGNGIAMIMAFCLDQEALGGDKFEMTLAGSVYMPKELNPPPAMMLAAQVLTMPPRSITEETANANN